MKVENCPFCQPPQQALEGFVFWRDFACSVRHARDPLAKGHVLLTPREHCETIEEAIEHEHITFLHAIIDVQDHLRATYECDGFKVFWNSGRAAGQTVLHAHIHVVPCYETPSSHTTFTSEF